VGEATMTSQDSLCEKGTDANSHSAPLFLPGIPPIIVDFVLRKDEWQYRVMQTMKKTKDSNITAVLLVRSDLSRKVKWLVKPGKVKVVPFDDETDIPELGTNAIMELKLPPLLSERMQLSARANEGRGAAHRERLE